MFKNRARKSNNDFYEGAGFISLRALRKGLIFYILKQWLLTLKECGSL